MANSSSKCPHDFLQVDVSTHADEVGFRRPPEDKRASAATSSTKPPGKSTVGGPSGPGNDLRYTFPGPLVLPYDDLAFDPKSPPQSLRSWLREKERNAVTEDRKTIYVAGVPTIRKGLAVMKSWAEPNSSMGSAARNRQRGPDDTPKPPQAAHIREYLEAFYHGLEVKEFSAGFEFVQWKSKVPKGAGPGFVGLQSGDLCTRIRTRPAPDKTFSRQLNLNDILDAAIELLPKDAYAFLLLVDHDLYEDDDDDFCCGRAYGGSRVAVVSSSRYHPDLDIDTLIDREHMWPASHCLAYINMMCDGGYHAGKVPKPPPKQPTSQSDQPTPMGAAVEAALSKASAPVDVDGLWLSRLLRTTSHELGHCIALDHCIYYACVMQGTAGMSEDVRQPPYLCPVCLEKLSRGVLNVKPGLDKQQYIVDRYTALSKFCQKWSNVGMLAGYHAWLEARLLQLQTT